MANPLDDERPIWLFAYGTLVPPDVVQRESDGWVADQIQGRLFDLGPYPGLVDLDDPTASWVEGFARLVGVTERFDELDRYEGVDEGLYRRVITTTRAGRRTWIYVYAQPLPAQVRRPIVRWKFS